MLYYIILYYIMLYYEHIILYYIILYYITTCKANAKLSRPISMETA